MSTENLSDVGSTLSEVPAAAQQNVIDDSTYQQMLAVLENLTDHTHVFYDDYTTACACNCDCTCTRGTI